MRLSNWLQHLNRRDTPIFPKFTIFSKYLIIAISVIAAFYTVNSVLAQTNILKDKQDAITQGNNQESWLDEAMGSNIISTIKLATGVIPDDVLNGTATNWVPGGALGTTTNLIASVYTPQASGIQYIAQVKDNFLGKPAYAQGTGFVGLQPLLPIWRGFRNVVYLLASIVFIFIGIMIMLRIKISPQAVINIQNAIPQIITTLILVTFSYAIAGLLIDLTYILQGLAVSTLFFANGNPNSLLQMGMVKTLVSNIKTVLGGEAFYSLSDLISNNGFIQTFDLIGRLIPITQVMVISGILGGAIGTLLAAGGGPLIALGGGVLVGGGVSILVLLIFTVIIFIKMIQLLFGLIKAYINVLLKIILAPLEIGLGAFPGMKIGFSSWFIQLFAYLMVFPGVLLFLLFVNIIMEKIQAGGLWTPPLLGLPTTLYFSSGLGASALSSLFGIGAFMLVAKLPEMIPQVIFAIKPSPWGAAIGQATSTTTGLAKNIAINTGTGMLATGTGPLRGLNRKLAGLGSTTGGNDQSIPKTVADSINSILKGK